MSAQWIDFRIEKFSGKIGTGRRAEFQENFELACTLGGVHDLELRMKLLKFYVKGLD